MSTRLGVRRTTEVAAAGERTGPDGRLYYDIQTRVGSGRRGGWGGWGGGEAVAACGGGLRGVHGMAQRVSAAVPPTPHPAPSHLLLDALPPSFPPSLPPSLPARQVKSFASRNQLAVTQAEIEEGVVLEWDRRYIAVLGVAGKRLYEFRLQVCVCVCVSVCVCAHTAAAARTGGKRQAGAAACAARRCAALRCATPSLAPDIPSTGL